jgi:hypothetical protein
MKNVYASKELLYDIEGNLVHAIQPVQQVQQDSALEAWKRRTLSQKLDVPQSSRLR